MKKSENYEMNLPEGTDAYDVEHMNENVEKIDELLKENADNYKKHLNDKENPHKVTAKHLGLDKVIGDSNVEYTTQKVFGDNFMPIIELHKGGNLINAVKDLSAQVADMFSSLKTYFATKKENDETVVSNTVTGEIATATDSTDAPIISIKSNGYTKQDGTPTPDAQIEIEGLDKVSVKTCGKNLLNYDEWKKVGCTRGTAIFENNGVTITAIEEDTFTMYGTGYFSEEALIPVSVGEQYTISWEESSNTFGMIYIFNQNGNSLFNKNNNSGKSLTFTIPESTTHIQFRFGVKNAGTTISYKNIQIEKGDTVTPYAPYTETLAEIDLTEPLYEGDYIEYRADGTGVLHRKFMNFKPTTIDGVTTGNNLSAYVKLTKGYCKSRQTALCNYLTVDATMRTTSFNFGNNAEGNFSHVFFRVVGLTTKEEYQTWLNEHSDLEIVYELATPQEIELTAEQLAQFKNLRTFEPITNIISNGETTTQYYKANENGEAVGGLQERVENIENTRAVRVNGNAKQIYGDGVEGSMEVSRFQLDEKTYLVDIKVTLTKIPETLSGNGPSIDLSLSDLGFDSEASAYESMCILSSYYPIITNGGNYCLGGGMCSTDNLGRGFYFSFLPHKNTKGSISSVNTSVLAGCMMIRLQ